MQDLKEGGLLAITVPPRKQNIVGGHVSLWNTGTLLYHLILAGFDCSAASAACYGYNISVIVQKRTAALPALTSDKGDIELLAHLFPMPLQARQGFDGDAYAVSWDTAGLPEPMKFS